MPAIPQKLKRITLASYHTLMNEACGTAPCPSDQVTINIRPRYDISSNIPWHKFIIVDANVFLGHFLFGWEISTTSIDDNLFLSFLRC